MFACTLFTRTLQVVVQSQRRSIMIRMIIACEHGNSHDCKMNYSQHRKFSIFFHSQKCVVLNSFFSINGCIQHVHTYNDVKMEKYITIYCRRVALYFDQ